MGRERERGEGREEGKEEKRGEKKNCFSLDSVFSIVDETLSGVSATHTGF